jgi:tetratricopeptide (TPR) repeat protein
MQTRLSRFCEAIIEAGWLAALVVTPLFFNTTSSRVFEPDKAHLLRSIALIMASAWLVRWLDTGRLREPGEPGAWAKLRGTPLAIPTLALVASYAISTLLSVTPRISLFGSYVRMQGTLTFLAYIVIFFLLLSTLRSRPQIDRLLHAVVLTSLPVALYGIIQKSGLDPLPWGGDVIERVASTLGNSIFVAAYLIVAFFVTLERLLNRPSAERTARDGVTGTLGTGALLFILAVQALAILFSQSRGPWLGWLAGAFVFAMIGLRLLSRGALGRQHPAGLAGRLAGHTRGAWLALCAAAIGVVVLLLVLNTSQGPLAGLCRQPYVGRLCTVMSTTEGTNAVRALIWQGMADMMLPHEPISGPAGTPDRLNAIRPLVGYGPETLWVAYNSFYPSALARYESRNASPDRAHNETWDAMARGGLVQVLIQLFIFGSLFFHALRWLGLASRPHSLAWFAGLLLAGGAAGVLAPLALDGSLRFAGVGLPTGMMFGLMAYLTLDLLRGDESIPPAPSRDGLLILGLLAAVVAFFVEVHFGIAIVATLTHFWAFAAVIVLLGMRWVPARGEESTPVTTGGAAPAADLAGTAARSVSKRQPVATAAGTGRGDPGRRDRPKRVATSAMAAAPVSGAELPGRWTSFAPYVGIGLLVTVVLTWDFLVNQSASSSPFALLWDAFTRRPARQTYEIATSPMLLMLLLFTWGLGGILALADVRRERLRSGSGKPWSEAVLYVGLMAVAWLGSGLFLASRQSTSGKEGLAIFVRLATQIVWFDLALLGVGLALAAAVFVSRPIPPRRWGPTPALPLIAAPVLALAAAWLIFAVNVRSVQADTLYKQGLGYEGAGQWEGAAILYQEAARRQPTEDYYDLFLGRALLQLSAGLGSGAATLPEDLSGVSTAGLLPLVDRGMRSGNREDILRAAHASLVSAQRLNPLNTDHAANLARLHRAWAFAATPGLSDLSDQTALREALEQRPDDVSIDKIDRSIAHYRAATSMSPQNAQLWNELASVLYVRGDLPGALLAAERSLAVDSRFAAGQSLYADLLVSAGRDREATEAYRRAAELAPRDVATQAKWGVWAATQGDVPAAVAAFDALAQQESAALDAARSRLANLETLARNAGGFDRLSPAAASARDRLRAEVGRHQAQALLGFRNLALVLRDAGRASDAMIAARAALSLADETSRPPIETLISQLEGAGK